MNETIIMTASSDTSDPHVASPGGNLRAKQAQKAYAPNKAEKKPRWDLVEQHLPLVKSIVSHMRIHFPGEIDVADIHSVAVSGLITAAQNYDPSKNPSFGAYAGIRVRGALLDELRRLDWMPRQGRVNFKKYRKAEAELEQHLGRTPSDAEMAKTLKMSVKEIRQLKEQGKTISFVPLDISPDDNEDGGSLVDVLADANQPDARDQLEKQELIELLRVRLDKLPEMPKKVLAMYYLKGMRLAEIAESVGLTESRICQIHAQAITDLRKAIKQELSL